MYDRYRAWLTRQPPASPDGADGSSAEAIHARYRDELRTHGIAPEEADRHLRVIIESGPRLEVERWNTALTRATPTFNLQPNAFLAQMIADRPPGAALDVGMGQGRNALFLAQQGWTTTGFDPAERAVAAARVEAERVGLHLETSVVGIDDFDWGQRQWDLILLSYVGARKLVDRVVTALRPGGLLVVEAFHRDATKTASIGSGVVFESNELLHLFDRLRIIRYEDVEAVADFGPRTATSRVVRLAAQAP